ncbi:hypothetical protein C8R46DRAFT_1031309 [Mycena filopes]|nr:hypothetical protein C8R46DRAFT_1031309 [Mycena filopes]
MSTEGEVVVTWWRFANTIIISGLGAWKAFAGYRGQETTMTTVDWILGVGWTLIAYWLSILEGRAHGPWRGFFTSGGWEIIPTTLFTISMIAVVAFGKFMVGLRARAKPSTPRKRRG